MPVFAFEFFRGIVIHNKAIEEIQKDMKTKGYELPPPPPYPNPTPGPPK